MTLALRTSMTLEEFLAWEAGQEFKHEFDGFGPVAMGETGVSPEVGVTRAHAVIQGNLVVSLNTRLRGGPCRAFGSDLKIRADGSIRYPDAFVTCTAGPNASTVVHDPAMVFEILSPGTAKTDRITKNREYRATPSIQRYVMLEQDEIAATVFERAGADWIGHVLAADAVLRMPEIGAEVPLAELYDGFDPAAD